MKTFFIVLVLLVATSNADPVELKGERSPVINDHFPHDCKEIKQSTSTSGIYLIQRDDYSTEPVYCNHDTTEGGWLVFLKRFNGSVDFYRGWQEYRDGFGDLNGEFFLGLDKLHSLTDSGNQELLVVLEDFDGVVKTARYTSFEINDYTDRFRIDELGGYSGNAGDSLRLHLYQQFKTKDVIPNTMALSAKGSWWYGDGGTYDSNLCGRYLFGRTGQRGMEWVHFHSDYSLRSAQMMIRPK